MLHQRNKQTPETSSLRIRPPDESQTTADSNQLSDLQAPSRDSTLPRWLSVDQVRKLQRMRRETVLDAMHSGELPFERRGRICYIRLTDVVAWEAKRLAGKASLATGLVHPDLEGLLS